MKPHEWDRCADPRAMVAAVEGLAGVGPRRLRLAAAGLWRLCQPMPSWQLAKAVEAAEGRAYADKMPEVREEIAGYVVLAADAHEALRKTVEWLAIRSMPEAARQVDRLRCVLGNPFGPTRVGCSLGPKQCPNHSPAWLTRDARDLAAAAHAFRFGRCEACLGTGDKNPGQSWHHYDRRTDADDCPACAGRGRTHRGHLDQDRLAVLADCLEEAGCPTEEACGACDGVGEVRYTDAAGSADTRPCEACGGARLPTWVGGTGRVPNPLLAHLRSPGPHAVGCWAVDAVRGEL